MDQIGPSSSSSSSSQTGQANASIHSSHNHSQARFAPTLKHPKLSFMGMTGQQAMGWVPILGVWGVGVGALATLYLSDM